MAVITLSGILVSQAILPAVGITPPGGSLWTLLHNLSADWAVILVAVHSALHRKWIVNSVKRYALRPIWSTRRRAEVAS